MSILTQSAGCTTSEPNDASDPFAGYGAAEVHSALDRIFADLEFEGYAESGAEMLALDQAVREQVAEAKSKLPPGADMTVELRHNWATFKGLRRETEVFVVAMSCGVPTFSVAVKDVNQVAAEVLREYGRLMEAASAEHDRMAETDA